MYFSLENRVDFELKKLDKTTLIKQTHETVKQEKMHTMVLLQHLLEIENRGLHLELGFSNLHNFLVVEFKYLNLTLFFPTTFSEKLFVYSK